MKQINTNNDNRGEKDSLTLLYIFFLVVIFFWILTWLLLKGEDQRGTFGDMFGSVNALFSGLALAGIIFTILLQKKELGLQRIELKETRNEFITQNETLRQQRFENTLFQMISIHHEIIDKLSFSERSIIDFEISTYEKRCVIEKAAEDLKLNIEFSVKQKVVINGKEIYEDIRIRNATEAFTYLEIAYNDFYFVKYKQLLSHYYRNIYHIFKLIFTTNLIAKEQKQFYASIVRAQLSSDELFLILYNSLVDGLGRPNFLYLIRELDIMQNFDFSIIDGYEYHKEIYDEAIKNVSPEFTVSNPL